MCNKIEGKNASLFKTLPRSQAIYGSSVETFGPYPQHYTMQIYKFFNTFFILTEELALVNKKYEQCYWKK